MVQAALVICGRYITGNYVAYNKFAYKKSNLKGNVDDTFQNNESHICEIADNKTAYNKGHLYFKLTLDHFSKTAFLF